MDHDLGYNEEDAHIEPTDLSDVDLPRNPVSKKNRDILEQYAPIYQEDYAEFKKSLLKWLLVKGKRPEKQEGYAESTVISSQYKIEETFRWVWMHEGEYTKRFDPDTATQFLNYLRRKAGKDDNYLNRMEKAIKRVFAYWRDAENQRIEEWDHGLTISPTHGNTEKKGHDRFRPHEFGLLYDAAIGLNAVKSYDNKTMTPKERQRIKRMLSQRLQKPMDKIGPDDFKRANSWKIPSLISITCDTGLRPIEVGRTKITWFDLENGEMQVPKDESTKNEEYGECGLSDSSVNAIRRWRKERQSYEDYEGTDAMWLTRKNNPYSSGPLNALLSKLIEEAGIDPNGRNLTWYSIRHGVASHWAQEKGIYKAKKQLRHKDIETTLGYTHSSGTVLSKDAHDLW